MGVNVLTLKVLVAIVGILPEVAQVLAIGASLIVNFVGNKWWTFRDDDQRATSSPAPGTRED